MLASILVNSGYPNQSVATWEDVLLKVIPKPQVIPVGNGIHRGVLYKSGGGECTNINLVKTIRSDGLSQD